MSRALMRCAYADPPYPGLAHLYPEKEEVPYPALIERLVSEYPDGWALSLHSPALMSVLPYCPPQTRVLAWVKTWASFKPGVWPAYAWEPVLLYGGRKQRGLTVTDWHACPATTRRGMVGAKPESFCFWLFRCLGLEPADRLDDLYPGSGAVSRAWGKFQQQAALLLPTPCRKEEAPSLSI